MMPDTVLEPPSHTVPAVFTRALLDWLPWLEPLAVEALTERHMAGLVDAGAPELAGHAPKAAVAGEFERVAEAEGISEASFEREDLRFFSAGADQKLLSTHARGTICLPRHWPLPIQITANAWKPR